MAETKAPDRPEMPDPLEETFDLAKEFQDIQQLLSVYQELYGATFSSWQALDNGKLFSIVEKAIEAAFKGNPTPITDKDLGINIPDDISLST